MKIKVSDTIYYLGVNDRRKHLFENIWPLPNGVSYNAYLIKDEKTALLDTVEAGSSGEGFVAMVEEVLEGRELDYLIINHMELDHAGEIAAVVRRWPNVEIIGNSKTFKVLGAYYNITSNLMEVKDGDELSLGHHNLKFVFTPWVHWPETMMTYCTNDAVLFSADAFGTFGTLDGTIFDDEIDFEAYREEMRRYYSCIVGKYSNMVQKAFKKLEGVPIKMICPLHGPVWRNNPLKVVELYDRWSKYIARDGVVIIYASMYGNTGQVADYIARKLAEQGVRQIKVHDVSKTHISYLISDIWKYRGVILGSCAYNTQMFPLMENLTRELLHMGVKNKVLGVFGSYSWNGGGVRNLNSFAEEIGWERVGESTDIYGIATTDKLKACDQLAEEMAKKLLSNDSE
ncbi:MAG: FprA family A-type flavoprotein [Rikenellaceae bacterium]